MENENSRNMILFENKYRDGPCIKYSSSRVGKWDLNRKLSNAQSHWNQSSHIYYAIYVHFANFLYDALNILLLGNKYTGFWGQIHYNLGTNKVHIWKLKEASACDGVPLWYYYCLAEVKYKSAKVYDAYVSIGQIIWCSVPGLDI